MIVPNANLVTQEVTNWTLTDQLRRLDLPVGVNYGAAPKKVIELLEGVARGATAGSYVGFERCEAWSAGAR